MKLRSRLLLAISMVCLFACDQTLQEPQIYQSFQLSNETRNTLILKVEVISNGSFQSKEQSFAPGENAMFHTAIGTPEDQLIPSAIFQNIEVFKNTVAESNLLYSGIIDGDWKIETLPLSNNKVYRLTINF